MWTAVPPAKSSAPRSFAIQPPVFATKSSKAKTQCATGKYTKVAQMPAKTIQAPNFARSAIEPEISATVIAAKIPWKAINTAAGIVPISAVELSRPFRNVN